MEASAQSCAVLMLEMVPGVMKVIRQHMRSHRLPGMSVHQFRVLAFLDCYGSATLSAASDHVGTTLPSMSRMVQSLVHSQLVQRQAGSPDRRTVCLEITGKGRTILERARQATAEQLARLLGCLSPKEVGCLQEAMDVLRRILGPQGVRKMS
jgi:DNA-binding MarR family transcriptional regulator